VSTAAARVETEIRTYLLENHLFSNDDAQLGNDDSLLEKGIIDSTGILEVIMFLESQFGVTVKDSEMLPENFDSVNNIVHFVRQRKSAP
jgi:acyl carrier protein